MYWEQRQEQLWQTLEKDEAALTKRMDAAYTRESAALEKEIAAYYTKYGENGVIRYRSLLQSLGDDDKALLLERMDEFAQKYPEHADLLPVRESIYKLDRLEGLQKSIYLQQLELAAWDDIQLTEHLAKNAMRGYAGAAKFTGGGTYTVREDIVKKFVDTAWADGKNFSQRIWDNRAKLAGYLNQDFAMAMARGDSYTKCVKVLRERFDVGASSAKALAYTEGSFVMNESSMEAFADQYEEYAVSCARDSKVCDRCAPLNGKQFRIKERVAGENFPPFHTRCRCSYTIVVESVKENAGLETKDLRGIIGRKNGQIGDTDGYTVLESIERISDTGETEIKKEFDNFCSQYAYANEEHAVVITRDGTLYRLKGLSGTVNVNLVGEDALEGATVFHNHPVWDGFDSGDSFSWKDVTQAIASGTKNEYLISGNERDLFSYQGSKTSEEIKKSYKEALYSLKEEAFANNQPIEYWQREVMKKLSNELEGFYFGENI